MNTQYFGKIVFGAALLLVVLTGGWVSGQQTTERYIPIGQSPGVSGDLSYIGEIVAVDPATHTVMVRDDSGTRSIRVTETTRIWLDRSARKRENTTGTYEDCEVGRKVEVMHLLDDARTAVWIKIKVR